MRSLYDDSFHEWKVIPLKIIRTKTNFVSNLVNENCNFKSWETLKNEYHIDRKWYFQWMQLIHTIPLIWKQKINYSKKNVEKNCRTRTSPNKKH